MDLQFHGANCITVIAQNTRVVIDDNLSDLGGKSATKSGDIALFTGIHADPVADAKLTIDMPGEYEVGDVSLYGLPARAHIDEDKQRTATMYKLISKDVRLLVLGHVYPQLSDGQLERIGPIDVVVVPVGGNGFTLDATGAMALIKKLEPKVVVPTYYADDKLSYPVPAQTLDQAVKGLGMDVHERVGRLKLKQGGFGEDLQLVVLEKS